MIKTLYKIKPFISEIGTLCKLTFAFITGKYRNISRKAIIGIVIALIYLLNPIDLVPDFLSIFGFIDDAALLALIAKLLEDDLDKFKEWENSNK